MANLGSCHIVPPVDMSHTRRYSLYIPLYGRTILFPPRLRPLSAKTWPRGLSARHISSSRDPKNGQVPTKSSNHLALSLGAALLAGLAGYNLGAQTRSTSSDTTQIYGDAQAVLRAKRELEASNLSVLDDPGTLESYGTSANSHHPASRHSLVVKVYGTEDVIKVVNVARKHRIPVTPYSGGTSLEGHFAGYSDALGGICIDLSGMKKVIQINEADGDMIVQSGITWEEVNNTLAERNIPLFFPLDPGPGATIGGMIGTGCSGTNAVRYGTAKGEWFINVTVVLPNGEVIKTRSRAHKSSAGFDLTKLFVGAEGTLGIVTEATLRLAPRLPTSVAVAQFPNVQAAVSAVTELLRSDMSSHIQCVELLDVNLMEAIRQAGQSNKVFNAKDSLFFKFQGSPSSIKETSILVKRIVEKHGSTRFNFARNGEEAEELWNHRKIALWSVMEWVDDSNARIWTTDVCVPPSRLPQLVAETKRDIDQQGIISCVLGHVGDGNFHALLAFKSDEELETVQEAVHRLIHRAIALDGTCTGEHGVGVGKREYLEEELGSGTVELMKRIKRTIDPLNLFNPGKLYPDDSESRRSAS